MGHKGVSKRKPKKSNSSINSNASNIRVGESPSVQSLVKDKDALLNRGSANPFPGSNKKSKKGK